MNNRLSFAALKQKYNEKTRERLMWKITLSTTLSMMIPVNEYFAEQQHTVEEISQMLTEEGFTIEGVKEYFNPEFETEQKKITMKEQLKQIRNLVNKNREMKNKLEGLPLKNQENLLQTMYDKMVKKQTIKKLAKKH